MPTNYSGLKDLARLHKVILIETARYVEVLISRKIILQFD